MRKTLGKILFGASMLFLLNCPTQVPIKEEEKTTSINYRAEITAGDVDEFTMTCGVIDADGDFVDGLYSGGFSNGLPISQTIETKKGYRVKLKVTGKGDQDGTLTIKIKNNLTTVVSKDIVKDFQEGSIGYYSINDSIEYYIPKN
ncbi:hypothetical protein M0R19_02615 [Candidatus Pacearchaeota archaeon]|jgi:hypothetical protein|nr:hypothetical protein [Candidatus Pacearchaeota archaeon]